jgi:hypothetical protein
MLQKKISLLENPRQHTSEHCPEQRREIDEKLYGISHDKISA